MGIKAQLKQPCMAYCGNQIYPGMWIEEGDNGWQHCYCPPQRENAGSQHSEAPPRQNPRDRVSDVEGRLRDRFGYGQDEEPLHPSAPITKPEPESEPTAATKPIPLRSPQTDFPNASGVYLISDPHGQVVYIGQSNNIQKHLDNHDADDALTSAIAQGVYEWYPFTEWASVVAKARDLLAEFRVSWVLTDDLDAVEQDLVEEHRPRFNRAMPSNAEPVDVAVAETCPLCLRPLDGPGKPCHVCAKRPGRTG